MILHLDHANELLMKSYLIREGYIINYLDKDELKKGIKKDELLDRDKTIEYIDCLKLVCKKVNFPPEKMDKMIRFHKLRNEIQHRRLNVPLNKNEEIENFYPVFRDLYFLMFPIYAQGFPVFIF